MLREHVKRNCLVCYLGLEDFSLLDRTCFEDDPPLGDVYTSGTTLPCRWKCN